MASVQDEIPEDVKVALQTVGEAISMLPSASRRANALSAYTKIREFMGAVLAVNVMLRNIGSATAPADGDKGDAGGTVNTNGESK